MTIDEAYAEADKIYGQGFFLIIQTAREPEGFSASITGMARDINVKTKKRCGTAADALTAVIKLARAIEEIEE